jgi:hypothetical protein
VAVEVDLGFPNVGDARLAELADKRVYREFPGDKLPGQFLNFVEIHHNSIVICRVGSGERRTLSKP